MRILKFRAWIGNKMWEWGRFDFEESIKDRIVPIMQFINLHDKNGKEIYEGDILSPGYTDKEVYIVRFDESKARFCEQRHLIGNSICDYGYFMDGSLMRNELDPVEIIGNIYEYVW